MRTELFETAHSVRLVIDPFDKPRESAYHVKDYITVTKAKKFGSNEWSPAVINWSALGSVSLEKTKLFTEGLAHAMKEARMMDERLDSEEVAHDL